MAKVTERIKSTAFDLLEQHPDGLRYSELHAKIKAIDSNFNSNTIKGCIWNLDTAYPEKVYKPSKGLFRLLKYKPTEKFELLTQIINILIILFSAPLKLLNTFGMIVSGIWLIIIGKWSVVIYGLLISFLGLLLLMYIFIPLGIMSFYNPSNYFLEKEYKKAGLLFLFFYVSYTILITTTWCSFILYYFVFKNEYLSYYSLIPILIYSYDIATNPIAYMASLEQGLSISVLVSLFVRICYIIIICMILFLNIKFYNIILIFGLLMLGCLLIIFKWILEDIEKATGRAFLQNR